MIILIMGLPGAGKTTLARELLNFLDAKIINADEQRKKANDWDFSKEGRNRQSERVYKESLKIAKSGSHVLADFICPTEMTRKLFLSDFLIWVDTIKKSRFDDTNQLFTHPKKYDFHVTTQDAKYWAPIIFEKLKIIK
jgi:adenylylsulfate kinase